MSDTILLLTELNTSSQTLFTDLSYGLSCNFEIDHEPTHDLGGSSSKLRLLRTDLNMVLAESELEMLFDQRLTLLTTFHSGIEQTLKRSRMVFQHLPLSLQLQMSQQTMSQTQNMVFSLSYQA